MSKKIKQLITSDLLLCISKKKSPRWSNTMPIAIGLLDIPLITLMG
jgi:hypothetical protein